jgi:GT2 family glycosyltransferase
MRGLNAQPRAQYARPDLSVVIVSFNTRDITRQCLSRVFRNPPRAAFEVIVVDNASQDGSARMVAEEFPQARLKALRKNKGFAGGNNEGIRCASGRYILLLNSDAFVGPGVLQSCCSFMDHNLAVGVLGCRLVGPDGALQPCARMLPGHLNKILSITGLAARFPGSRFFGRADHTWWDHSAVRTVDWVVGAFFLVRAPVFRNVGLLDERYFLYSEELDFCRSAAAYGWEVVFYPHAQVVHLGGSSVPDGPDKVLHKSRQLSEHRIRSELRYYRKWHGPLKALVSALIEIAWQGAVLVRNLPSSLPRARARRREALRIVRLIVSILREDGLGKGVRP